MNNTKNIRELQSKPITLNFLSCNPQSFPVSVYRKECDPSSSLKSDGDVCIKRYDLPKSMSDEQADRISYDIQFEPAETFDPFECTPLTKFQMTLEFLYRSLLKKAQAALPPQKFYHDPRSFRRYIDFVLHEDGLGSDVVWLEPYYLESKRNFGFLIGFRFKSKQDRVSRETLKRSLSLSQEGRENTDFYVDHYSKCEAFLNQFKVQLFPLDLPNESQLDVTWPSEPLECSQLDSKTYILANDNHSKSQFNGLKSHGPLQKADDSPVLCFMYRQEDKPLAHDLFFALKGDRYQTFPGMQRMFGISLDKNDVKGIALAGFDENDLEESVQKVKAETGDRTILPIILFPWSRNSDDPEGEKAYYTLKHVFLRHKLPTQLVSVAKLSNSSTFKWSIGNIGLAVFGKLGGKPWKVAPQNRSCLIIGIGQSHRRQADRRISRYFAYSVLSDSSGLYETIKVLAKNNEKDAYLSSLMSGIIDILKNHADDYDTFVIHTPFSLRRDETQYIHKALQTFAESEGQDKQLVAMKFNDRNKYMGFALWNNSRVPFESTFISLGRSEYLVWFEGLQYHNPTVKRRIARPMHIEFTYPIGHLEKDKEIDLLQDAINLSGANWRGFNAKSLPVSVYYARLISQYIGHFDQLGLSDIDIEDMPPWFL